MTEAVIEGRKVLVLERKPPLQPNLERLLGAMTLVVRYDVRVGGTSRDCEVLRDHRFELFREGRHVGLDGLVRDLRLLMCADCQAVCVRDVSYDHSVDGEVVPIGRGGRRRRDEVLGWYSGARRNRREYR